MSKSTKQLQPHLVFGSLGEDEAINTIPDSVELPKTVAAHLKQHKKPLIASTGSNTSKTKQHHTRDTNKKPQQQHTANTSMKPTTTSQKSNEQKSSHVHTVVNSQQQQQNRTGNKPNMNTSNNANSKSTENKKKSSNSQPRQQQQQIQKSNAQHTTPTTKDTQNVNKSNKSKRNQSDVSSATNKNGSDTLTSKTTAPVQEQVVPQPDPSSWAELFGAAPPAKNVTATTESTSPAIDALPKQAVATPTKKSKKNKKAKKEDAVLETNNIQYELSNVYITPRGLKNVRNSCYINAGIQSLLPIPPFYNLFKKLGSMGLSKDVYPLTRAMSQFVNEFQASNKAGDRVDIGIPFTPSSILDYMRNVNTDILRHGDQHDVHEFLQYLLHELHSELRKTNNALNVNDNLAVPAHLLEEESPQDEDDGWQEVGKNNKASTVQEIRHDDSPISKLFSGKMRSLVKKRSAMGSLTLQPFYSLHLPIDSPNINSLKDSLKYMTGKEQLDNASMQFALEDVPDVLVIQLIRFKYEDNRSIKIGKHIEFSDQLYLDKSVIGTAKMKENDPKRYYELQSVICHHGKGASGGHYSTYVHHPNNKWIHLDDQIASVVPLDYVLNQQAYVLIYVRSGKPHNATRK